MAGLMDYNSGAMNEGAYGEDRTTTARLASRLRESAGKEGVYYIVRFPTRWRLYAFPWEDFGDLWHGDVWRRFVVEDLAEACEQAISWVSLQRLRITERQICWERYDGAALTVSC